MKLATAQRPMLYTLLFCLTIYGQETIAQSNEGIKPEDLKGLIGDWTGTLTYIDYRSNEPYTMPAKLSVTAAKNDQHIVLSYIYPNEPKANSTEDIKISKNGSQLNKKEVKSRKSLSNGDTRIVTEYSGKDNDKKAVIRNEYTVGATTFIITKKVRFDDTEEWLKRNEYSFTRQ